MAHTTNATDTRNTLRDTEPEGERQWQRRERQTEMRVLVHLMQQLACWDFWGSNSKITCWRTKRRHSSIFQKRYFAICLPSFLFPFIVVIWQPSSVRQREMEQERGGHKGSEKAPCSCCLHVSVGDAHMSGRDNITRPEAVQLPASFFSLLSRKSFGNFVPVLTDENFFHSLPFFISISFNYCLSTMSFIPLSAKRFRIHWHKAKAMLANNELITVASFFSATQLIIFRVPLYLKNSSDCWIFPWSLESIFHPILCTDNKFIETSKYWKRIS